MDWRSSPVLHYGWGDVGGDVNDDGLPPPPTSYADVTFEKYRVYKPWEDINELAALYYAKTGTASVPPWPETVPYGDDSVLEECAKAGNSINSYDDAATCAGVAEEELVKDKNKNDAAASLPPAPPMLTHTTDEVVSEENYNYNYNLYVGEGNNVNQAALVHVSPQPPAPAPSPWMPTLAEDIQLLLLDNWSMPAPAEIPELAAPPAAHIGRSRRPRDVWSEEEHLAFLRGLKANLKGDWKSISKHFVPTKTTIQIASHAQKYFNRQESNRQNAATKRLKRRSIHDITTDHI
ncbi:hypothetical protein V2J09_021519 [Rumex salicifolius]